MLKNRYGYLISSSLLIVFSYVRFKIRFLFDYIMYIVSPIKKQ